MRGVADSLAQIAELGMADLDSGTGAEFPGTAHRPARGALRNLCGCPDSASCAQAGEQCALQHVLEQNADAVLVVRSGGDVSYANAAAETLFGRSRDALVGTEFGYPIVQGAPSEIDIFRAPGDQVTAEMRVVRTAWGGVPAAIVALRDVSEQRRLEEQLRHAQKMEALGRLAGGISHDFNNLLTSILCEVSVLSDELPEDDPRRRYVDQIRETSTRAAELTNQLLMFSRKKVVQQEVFDLNSVIHDVERMLRRLIGEHIKLTPRTSAEPLYVNVGRGQIEQVIVNLALNARDAMPDGGSLVIETGDARIHIASDRQAAEQRPADFVSLTVRDTGCGMSEEVQAHLFEPFFTTKPDGQGSGLGLSVVYGVVQQVGGRITLFSEPGSGSTFQVLLPRAAAPQAQEPAAADERVPVPALTPRNGSHTILLAEDEVAIREVIADILERQGFRVLSAADGAEASEMIDRVGLTVDLLITDVAMPNMSGTALADRVLRRWPGTLILFLSGYPKGDSIERCLDWQSVAFLSKPFSPAKLVESIQKLIARRASSTVPITARLVYD
jgi:two-component system cell cycle sensor histidine kinase/response regulator CckA